MLSARALRAARGCTLTRSLPDRSPAPSSASSPASPCARGAAGAWRARRPRSPARPSGPRGSFPAARRGSPSSARRAVKPFVGVEAHDDDAASARHFAHLVEGEHEQPSFRRQRRHVIEAGDSATGASGSSSGASVMNVLPAFTRDTMSCSDAMKPYPPLPATRYFCSGTPEIACATFAPP